MANACGSQAGAGHDAQGDCCTGCEFAGDLQQHAQVNFAPKANEIGQSGGASGNLQPVALNLVVAGALQRVRPQVERLRVQLQHLTTPGTCVMTVSRSAQGGTFSTLGWPCTASTPGGMDATKTQTP